MPFKRYGKCVFKIKKNKKGKTKKMKKQGCSKSTTMAKKYLKALYANSDDVVEEIKDYFNNKKDEDYMAFDKHPLSNIGDLMDVTKPAPWDHLTNVIDDDDVDIDIKEDIKK
ncbi:MAG: hypothetical protein CMF52_07050 [Legionellales bacterium]|nr:hypothetical protein [Legionellales bacterium]|tara:strand:+ start:3450 stop:3785 length:336 start_codon:yes stop_codon:yes gene_type:complete